MAASTLLARLGPHLAAELGRLLTRCRVHGPAPWVPVCRCVLEGAPAAEATTSSALCEDHVRLAEEGHPGADEDIDAVCLLCLIHRGIVPG